MAKKREKGGVLGLGYIPDARKRIADIVYPRVDAHLSKKASRNETKEQSAVRRAAQYYKLRINQGAEPATAFAFASDNLADEIDTIPGLTYEERGAMRIRLLKKMMQRVGLKAPPRPKGSDIFDFSGKYPRNY